VPLDLSDAGVEMHRLSDLIDKGLDALRIYAHESAAAERDYRHLRALSWLATPRERDSLKLTAGEREAMVDAETAEARYTRDLASDMRQAALEAVRARRAQLSAYQSLLAADRAEAEFVRTGPR
jgi:hypothetical protein